MLRKSTDIPHFFPSFLGSIFLPQHSREFFCRKKTTAMENGNSQNWEGRALSWPLGVAAVSNGWGKPHCFYMSIFIPLASSHGNISRI